MRTLLFALTIFLIGLTSCKSTETETPQQAQEQLEEVATSRSATSFDDNLKSIIAALKNQDDEALNEYIDQETGLYSVLSTQGSYSECLHYTASADLFKDSEETNEYEENAVKYLLDYLNNVNMSEMEIVHEDMFGIEACSFEEEGFFVDSNDADIKILTDIYDMNLNGEEKDPKELVKLGSTQSDVKKTVFIGDGEVTYTLYLTEKDNKWWITIMDLRDCDT